MSSTATQAADMARSGQQPSARPKMAPFTSSTLCQLNEWEINFFTILKKKLCRMLLQHMKGQKIYNVII